MARKSEPKTKKKSRRKQLVQTYKAAKKTDPKLGLIILAWFVLGFLVGGAVFWLIPPRGGTFDWIMTGISAFLMGVLAATVVFFRRAQKSMYDQLEGRQGAAATALTTLKKGWKTDPMVAFNKQQDIVHRVVGPPGVVLVGEGEPARLKNLLGNERRKHERVLGETPIIEIVVGDDKGQVPLRKLSRHLMKMKRTVRPADMTDILNRLKAIDAHRPNIPLPKGPMPSNMKGMRSQMRGN